jgi:hypothetical protein
MAGNQQYQQKCSRQVFQQLHPTKLNKGTQKQKTFYLLIIQF